MQQRLLDGHVHLVGDGTAGDGCILNLRGLQRRVQARFLLRSCGLSAEVLRTGLDQPYREQLRKWIGDSDLDGCLLLAMDWPYHADGTALHSKAAFYTPNDAVLKLAAAYPEFIPAISIHPARTDAIAELERCHAAGARVLKLLPNVHNVDCARSAYRSFWSRCAELGFIFLSHTGGELALPVVDARLADPTALRAPLNVGVTCIAAHCGTRDLPWQRCGVDEWIGMCREFPHLYGDNSALATPNRAYALKRLLDSEAVERLIHGSDYPIPCGPWGPRWQKLLSAESARIIREIQNPVERDFAIKKAIGMPEGTFTRLSQLLTEAEAAARST